MSLLRALAAATVLLISGVLHAQGDRGTMDSGFDPLGTTPQVAATYSPAALSRIARRLDPHLNWHDYALAYLQKEKPQRYNSVSHDKVLLEAEITRMIAELKADVQSNFSTVMTYDVIAETDSSKMLGKQKSEVKLNSRLMEGNFPIDTEHGRNDAYLPSSYILLFANAELGTTFTVEGVKALELHASLEEGERENAFLRVEFEVFGFNQHANVQVVIRKVDWFQNAERTILIASATEKRSPKSLMKKRFLSEGFTFVADPDHTLLVDDSYMLELLHEDSRNQRCKEQKRERGHRVFECQVVLNGEGGIKTVHRYVGGRRAEVRFYRSEKDSISREVFQQKLQRMYVQQQATDYDKPFVSGTSTLTPSFANYLSGKGPYLLVQANAYLELKAGEKKYGVVP